METQDGRGPSGQNAARLTAAEEWKFPGCSSDVMSKVKNYEPPSE